MTVRFDPALRLILVEAAVEGPSGSITARLALDTGSTRTVIDPDVLQAVGLHSDPTLPDVHLRSVTGVGNASLVRVDKLTALGLSQADILVVAFLPRTTMRLDGLLGLDFFRDRALRIDFRRGEIELT